MRILIINTVYAVGSTGKLVKQIAEAIEQSGSECRVAHRYNEKDVTYPSYVVSISSWWDCHIHNRLSRLFMLRGFFSRWKTKRFLKEVDAFKPDVIHLHNIHGNFIHLPLLFRYLKKHRSKVVWTFHDCWPLTGNCKNFDMVGCDKWKSGCGHCPQKGEALLDLSAFVYRHKQNMLQGLYDVTVVTPSRWLADLVRQSPLGVYPIRVIRNGIDRGVFSPKSSDVKAAYGITGKKMVLGVAFAWTERKGLDVFLTLAERLPKDYCLVLVGTDDAVDRQLPPSVISIHKTNDQQELAALYTAADVFVNPTREDNYPTVNMEALACGTPVVTFKTGGSSEMIDDTCGCAVARENVETLLQEIVAACEGQKYTKEACLEKAKQFDGQQRVQEYIQLYEEIV